MHIAHVDEAIDWAGARIAPGHYYLEDHNAAELLWASRGFGEVRIYNRGKLTFEPGQIWKTGARVLVVRVGGFGDLLWLNPIYKEMRAAGVHVAHCCFPRYAPVLEGFVDEIVPYPLSVADSDRFDEIVWLENAIEGKPCLGDEHPAERLQAIFKCPRPVDVSGYNLTKEEWEEWAGDQWPRTGKTRVCVQVQSSGGGKNYPHMERVLPLLWDKGYEILLVGDPREAGEDMPENIFDCTQKGFTIRQSIAMAAWCDAIIAPDSVFVHVGHALNIPVLGLFGPFSAPSYMKGYRGAAMQGRAKCSPCSWHPRGTPFPPSGPCATSGYCNALANIPPKDVVYTLSRILK